MASAAIPVLRDGVLLDFSEYAEYSNTGTPLQNTERKRSEMLKPKALCVPNNIKKRSAHTTTRQHVPYMTEITLMHFMA